MKLLIVIPALNEEKTIADVIQQSLNAAQKIAAESPVTDVEITVVSDSATDQAVSKAKAYTASGNLIIFKENRGYGAAIKEAWRQFDAELLAFLDADGTCDPRFFAQLCSPVVAENADLALGSRMHRESQMPRVRQAGNALFGLLLPLLTSSRV